MQTISINGNWVISNICMRLNIVAIVSLVKSRKKRERKKLRYSITTALGTLWGHVLVQCYKSSNSTTVSLIVYATAFTF